MKKKAPKKIKFNKLKKLAKPKKKQVKAVPKRKAKVTPKPVLFVGNASFSARLKDLRLGCGMSERTIQMVTGIPARRLVELEAKLSKPTSAEIELLARALGKSPDFLAKGI